MMLFASANDSIQNAIFQEKIVVQLMQDVFRVNICKVLICKWSGTCSNIARWRLIQEVETFNTVLVTSYKPVIRSF